MLLGYVLGAMAFLGSRLACCMVGAAQPDVGGDPGYVWYTLFALLVLLFSLLLLLSARLALRASARLHSYGVGSAARRCVVRYDSSVTQPLRPRLPLLDLDVWLMLAYFLDLAFPSAITLLMVIHRAILYILFAAGVCFFYRVLGILPSLVARIEASTRRQSLSTLQLFRRSLAA